MEKYLVEKEDIEDNKIEYTNNVFITFIEEYYGHFKQFVPFEVLYKIGKVNRRLISLFLIDKGNKLYNKKKSKEEKLNMIILVSKFRI